MKTNLFIAGACKCGTSFLHDFLGKQADICASIPKEPYFFELPKEKRNETTYFKTHFKGYKSELYLLDSRHRNMFFSSAATAIFEYNPKAKFIFILRNPVERAHSHWWMWYSRKIITKNFDNTLRKEIYNINKGEYLMDLDPNDYLDYVKNNAYQGRMAYADANSIVESGLYYRQIQNFKQYFNDRSILILDYKEIANIEVLANTLEMFLDVKIEVKNKSNEIINKAPEFYKKRNVFAKFLPVKIKFFIKNKFYKKPKIKNKTNKMLQEFYKEENNKLITCYGLNFVKKWQNDY